MTHSQTVARLLGVCLTLGGLLSCAAADLPTVTASRAQGRAGSDTPAARPTRGLGVVSIRDRQGQQVGLYRASYALVIGVSGYVDWPQLPGVLQDIRAVVAMLQAQGFQVEQVYDPTLDDLRRAFDTFINTHGQEVDHRLLIYFAGHGHTMSPAYGGEMGYLVPRDAPLPHNNEAGFRARALSMQEIEVYARRMQSKHVLFLFDSCFSGTIFAPSRAVPDYITYQTSQPVRQFITSGTATEKVPDVSIFRERLVAAIQGEADTDHDGYITGTELGIFLQKQVTNYSRNAQHPQYGKILDPRLDKGDFVFAAVHAALVGQDGAEMVLVPAGEFSMGSNVDEIKRLPNIEGWQSAGVGEIPRHQVYLDAFYIDKYEVTNARFQQFVQATGYRTQAEREGWGYVDKGRKWAQVNSANWRAPQGPGSNIAGLEQHPVVQVSQEDAKAYCGWAGKRLPTEAEWEKAARGTDGQSYPWGNQFDGKRANFCDANCEENWKYNAINDGYRYTAPIGSYEGGKSPYGAYDMAGNVWEWVSDWFDNDYYRSSPVRNPQGPASGDWGVVRGGGWSAGALDMRVSARVGSAPPDRDHAVGFRCAKNL